jgi:hypothetical protein
LNKPLHVEFVKLGFGILTGPVEELVLEKQTHAKV